MLTFPLSPALPVHRPASGTKPGLGVVYRTFSQYLIKKTRFTVASGAKTGAVTLTQRFGSALNLNIHVYMCFLDGLYAFDGARPKFHRSSP